MRFILNPEKSLRKILLSVFFVFCVGGLLFGCPEGDDDDGGEEDAGEVGKVGDACERDRDCDNDDLFCKQADNLGACTMDCVPGYGTCPDGSTCDVYHCAPRCETNTDEECVEINDFYNACSQFVCQRI